jgi:hypothetical protein
MGLAMTATDATTTAAIRTMDSRSASFRENMR